MRIPASFAVLTFAAALGAQSPLTTLTGGANQGNVGNNIFFDLQIIQTVTIHQIDFRCGANTAASSGGILEVWLGPTTYVGNHLNASLWTPVASASGIAVAPSTVATAMLTKPLTLGPGNYGVALKATAFNHGYTDGNGNATPGSGSNQTFTRNEMILRAGANQNTPWISGLNAPRVWNGAIHYTLGGNPIVIAAWEQYGVGCYKWFHSFYETYLNPSTSFDIKGTATATNSLRLSFLATGYQVGPFLNGSGTFYLPTTAATKLNLTNQSTAQFPTPFPVLYPGHSGPLTTNMLEVCDNGFISPVAGNGTLAVPTIAALLNGGARWAPAWFDFDPSLGGTISWERDPNGTQFYVTWQGVPDLAAAATSNTMQVMFMANGDVEYRWGAMSLATGGVNPALTGWTPGTPVLDPDIVDISAITAPFRTGPSDNPPLTLALQARPRIGTTLQFTTSNIPAGTSIGALVLGGQQLNPGTPLGFIGMPQCFAYVNLASTINITFPVASSSTTLNVPLANDPTLNGLLLFGQSVTITPGYNSLGALSSNGARMVIGSL